MSEAYPNVNFLFITYNYNGATISSDTNTIAKCAKIKMFASSSLMASFDWGAWPPMHAGLWDKTGKHLQSWQSVSDWNQESPNWRTSFQQMNASMHAALDALVIDTGGDGGDGTTTTSGDGTTTTSGGDDNTTTSGDGATVDDNQTSSSAQLSLASCFAVGLLILLF